MASKSRPLCTRIGPFLIAAAMAAVPAPSAAQTPVVTPTFGVVDIGEGITLHYAEAGTGTPVVFVHGSLSDYEYWKDQVGLFSRHYRAIAYSRRYNFPNTNPARPGYSAITDADDLAAFITKLGLGKVDVVGHSYGALTALFLARAHPELVRALVLAEPPAVSLLRTLPADESRRGKEMFADIQRRMVAPMQAAFRKGDRERGVETFIDYVFGDPAAWRKMSAASRADTMRDAHEWDVMMTSGTLFPTIEPEAIRRITVPVLLLSGAKSYPFIQTTDAELARLLPDNRHLVLSRSGHQMWYQQADDCRAAVEAFLRLHDGTASSTGL
jgi:non-heme chloroperoxidase